MFKDVSEKILEEVESALETYSFEDILELNDLTVEEALTILIENGYVELPEVRSVR